MTISRAPLAAPLYVTKPVLPPLTDYVALLEGIWSSGKVTNLGPLHEQFERGVAARAGYGLTSLWNNGTTALMAMLAAFELKGEVIVTPVTFPATVHAIRSIGLTPVFADVEPQNLTLAPDAVEERITDRTSAILGTHIYGIACDTPRLADVATRHGAALLLDGAHSFAVPAPVFDSLDALGDATMLSFHATKLFHSVEGGAVLTPHAHIDARLRKLRNFGIEGEDAVSGMGLNGKMSELHAAMGLLTLDLVDAEILARTAVARRYTDRLADVEGLRIVAGTDASKQYFVIRVDAKSFGKSRDEIHVALRRHNVMSRRYFYPLCSDIDIYSDLPSARDLPHARRAVDEVLALPFYGALGPDLVDYVCDIIVDGATT